MQAPSGTSLRLRPHATPDPDLVGLQELRLRLGMMYGMCMWVVRLHYALHLIGGSWP
jgi:hypothetical protein